MSRLLSLFWLFACVLLTALSARAQLTLTLTPTARGSQGATVAYQASVRNTGASPVYLNQLSVTFDGSDALDVDPTPFYNGFEGELAAGASVTSRTCFTVKIDPSAAAGSFAGAVRILGGANADALGNLAQGNVALVVSANTAPPETYIINGPASGTQVGAPEVTFTFTGSDSDTPAQLLRYKWRIDANAFQGPSAATSATVANLAYGTHTFTVAAVDEAGAEDLSPATRTFEVVKPKVLIAAPDQPAFQLDPTVAQEQIIRLTNLGRTTLTGISGAVSGAAANVQVTLTGVPTQLLPMASADVTVRALATDQSVLSSTPLLRFTSAEGEEATANVACTVVPRIPRLTLDPNPLIAAMLRGQQTLVESTVKNEGSVAAQDVRVVLPNAPWLSVVSPTVISTLLPGESAKVSLSLLPQETMTLGPYTGTIGINPSNAAGVGLNFTFNLISDRKGTLKLTAEDEYTYFAEGTPNLAGAHVVVKDKFTGAIVAEGDTETTAGPNFGQLTILNLTEGYYNIEVTAPNHGAFKSDVEVVGGTTKSYKPFLPRQFVQYTWNVVPVDTSDQYQVTLDAIFETHVPAPVLTMNPLVLDLRTLNYDEEGKAIVYYTVTNQGIIALNQVRLSFSSGNGYTVTSPVSDIGTLPALKTITVPVTIQRAEVRVSDGQCGLTVSCSGCYTCGLNPICQVINGTQITGDCPPSSIIAVSSGGGGPVGFEGVVSSPPPLNYTPVECDPCKRVTIEVLGKRPNGNAYITYDDDGNPQMPDIRIKIKGDGVITTRWYAELTYEYKSAKCPEKYYKRFPSSGENASGREFSIDFGSEILGGELSIFIEVFIDGRFCVVKNVSVPIRGDNPPKNVVLDAARASGIKYLDRLICQETSVRQFKSDGTPLVGPPNGIGVGQIECSALTGLPREWADFWDWRQNLSKAIQLYNIKQNEMETLLRTKLQPTGNSPLPETVNILVDGMMIEESLLTVSTILYYNGLDPDRDGTSNYYLKWDDVNMKWVEDNTSYVDSVLSHSPDCDR
ncbi:MAG: hypothetical protein QM758_13580 [Armatimonas sp.]